MRAGAGRLERDRPRTIWHPAGVLAPIERALAGVRETPGLAGIMLTTALVMSGQGVITPVLPLFADAFGASVASVGLTLTAFGGARLVLNVPLGIAADRFGRRPLLIVGPIIVGIGMVGSGTAGGIPELLLWRIVAGAGSATYMTAAQIYLVDISAPKSRARIIGSNQAALLFGVSIGPGIGGVLADSFGLRVPFFVVGGACALAAGFGYFALPDTLVRTSTAEAGGDPAPSGFGLLKDRDFLAICVVTATVFLNRAGARFTLIPLLAASELGYEAGQLGVLFTVMAFINLAGLWPASTLTDRVGRKAAIVPSGILTAIATAALAWTDDPELFVAFALTIAVGTSVMGPAPAVYAADIAPEKSRGLAMGLYRSAGDIGFVTGPILLGTLADQTTLRTALYAASAWMLLVSVGFGLLARESRHLHEPPTATTS